MPNYYEELPYESNASRLTSRLLAWIRQKPSTMTFLALSILWITAGYERTF
jgi:hypothetical protein